MKRLGFALLLLVWSVSPSWAASLTLSMQGGLVSLDAQDVTVRQILTEWARIGKTRIINVERITGAPVTLKFEGIPEKQALDIVLRSIPGYVALPRAAPVADASLYDRILIMATTTAVAALRPQQPTPGFPGMQGAMPGTQGGTVTQLRPNLPAPLSPGMLPEPPDSADQMDDPAIAAAAAAGLVPIPAFNPGPFVNPVPLMPPGGAQPKSAPSAPGVGAPINPFNVPVGTAQPSLAPPPPPAQAPPNSRVRPPQADR
ncbi:MAG: hypothetical protein ABIS29_10220 [Vicinamibacterales bacterium]